MANSPVDKNSDMMEEDHGTRVLITDPAADAYLEKSKADQWHKDLRWRSDLDASD